MALIAAASMSAQELKVDCDVYTNVGPDKEITLHLETTDGTEKFTYSNVHAHQLILEPGKEYVLSYEKNGFRSKSILIEAPRKLFKNKEIAFDVLLEVKDESAYAIKYKEPVARIHFDQNNNMLYDTDYSTDVSTADIKADSTE